MLSLSPMCYQQRFSHGRKQSRTVTVRLVVYAPFILHGMETPPRNLRLHPPELTCPLLIIS
ncbi:unnamed protein product [Brassica napus]|uniref:(rape) hypothetical protein n=1 Tax=Brassica napus TaxID=3708 RepID=A0A816JXU9_BRANA|nr:unnamed protein product [Brassica napus]